MPDRKKAVTLIVGNMKPTKMRDGSPDTMAEPRDEDFEMAIRDAARKIIDAVNYKDVESFVTYMKELIYMCGEDQQPEEEYPNN